MVSILQGVPSIAAVARRPNRKCTNRQLFWHRQHNTPSGSHQECAYHLLTFGIPISILPFDADGNLTNDEHLRRIARIKEIEEKRKSAEALAGKIVTANTNDVVLGRGKSFQNHPGNQKLSMIIEQNQTRYQLANRNDKTTISKDLVALVQNDMGGRFLQKDEQNPSFWTVASEQASRLKVAHGFRAGKSRSVQTEGSDESEIASNDNGTTENGMNGNDMSLTESGRKATKMARFST